MIACRTQGSVALRPVASSGFPCSKCYTHSAGPCGHLETRFRTLKWVSRFVLVQLPSQPSRKLTKGLWKTTARLKRPSVHFHNCWKGLGGLESKGSFWSRGAVAGGIWSPLMHRPLYQGLNMSLRNGETQNKKATVWCPSLLGGLESRAA